MLMNKEGSDLAYIHRMQYFDKKEAEKKRQEEAELLARQGMPADVAAAGESKQTEQGPINPVYQAVLEGKRMPSYPWPRPNWPRHGTGCGHQRPAHPGHYESRRFVR